MKEKLYTIKRILFIIIITLFFLITIQGIFKIFQISPLNGTFVQIEKPLFSLTNWFTGNFQINYDKYLEENIGFRTFFIKVKNQIDFSLFKKINADKIVIGKDNYLFEQSYIDSYLGKDFVGIEALEEKVKMIKNVQEDLQNKGKFFVLMIAPGKASFYPEKISTKYDTIVKKENNYDIIKSLFSKYNINTIDVNKWFIELKEKDKNILYPKKGIHWSFYGATLAADTLIKYLQNSKNEQWASINIANINKTSKAIYPDNDLADLMNVFYSGSNEILSYPDIKYIKNKEHKKPKMLVIGDSFYWNWSYSGIIDSLFSNNEFWYYNNSVFPEAKNNSEFTVNKINVQEAINRQDFILILTTQGSLNNIGHGFIEQYCSRNLDLNNIKIQYYIDKINKDKVWLESVEKKAKEKNISLDEMVKLDAIYMVNEDNKNKDPRVDFFIAKIKNDKVWLEHIKTKAKEKNITLEQAIIEDAKYMVEQENKK